MGREIALILEGNVSRIWVPNCLRFGVQVEAQKVCGNLSCLSLSAKSVQELSRGSKSAPRGSKSAPRGPKSAPRCPKTGPREVQEASRAPQGASRLAKDSPKRPKERPKRPLNFTIDHQSKKKKKIYIDKTCCPSTLGTDIYLYD